MALVYLLRSPCHIFLKVFVNWSFYNIYLLNITGYPSLRKHPRDCTSALCTPQAWEKGSIIQLLLEFWQVFIPLGLQSWDQVLGESMAAFQVFLSCHLVYFL
ncbi:unnamed protein product [Cuscuta epithymum]|uniref:Uncharacterized protein n=1 Tax=Cuscuta epithymum TaxID=186058 RepID=A0AAV0CVZ6_9ASTE|nr:unnamed protein product [Cuscuta epithymum]CAH9129853.1 unnamed protein product [Cuscuta epithymum]